MGSLSTFHVSFPIGHQVDNMSSDAIALSQYLFSRKLPMEDDDLKKKAQDVQNTIFSKGNPSNS